MTISNYPTNYFDQFDSTENYVKILFLAGAGLQARELNEIQDESHFQLGSVAKFLFSDGTVMAGGGISGLTSTTISINAASIYAAQWVDTVPAATVTITGVGYEYIGLGRLDVIYTDLDDTTIREDDPLSPNYGNATSYREVHRARWANGNNLLTGEVFFPVITLLNGQVISLVPPGTGTGNDLADLINKYDNEVRGSAVIYGLACSYYTATVTNNVQYPSIAVASGRARVTGIPAVLTAQAIVPLDPVIDTRSVIGEPYSYTGNGTYSLRRMPVVDPSTISSTSHPSYVLGQKQITSSITRGGSAGGLDPVPNTPLMLIVSVVQGGTTYTSGVDYRQTGDSIDWSLAGAEPSPGSTYSATYRYNANFAPTLTADHTGVVLDSSNQLVAGTSFTVNYDYYLKRIDRVSIDSQANLVITKGNPGYETYNAPPYNLNLLSLCTVALQNTTWASPAVAPAVVTSDTVKNVTIKQQNAMINRLNNLEYDVATLSLSQQASASSPTLSKRNMFVDNLINDTQRDAGLTQSAVTFRSTLLIKSSQTVLGSTSQHFYLPFTETNPVTSGSTSATRTGDVLINAYAPTPTYVPKGKIRIYPDHIHLGHRWWWDDDFWEFRDDDDWCLPRCPFARRLERIEDEREHECEEDEDHTVYVFGGTPGGTIRLNAFGRTFTATANSQGTATFVLTVYKGTQSGEYGLSAVDITPNVPVPMTTYNHYRIVNSGVNFNEVLQRYSWEMNLDNFIGNTHFPNHTWDTTASWYYFTTLPASDVTVMIVEMLPSGYPDITKVAGFITVPRASIVLGWNKFTFPYPINLQSTNDGSSVGICDLIATPSAAGKIATVQFGKPNIGTNANGIATGALVNQELYDGQFIQTANLVNWSTLIDTDTVFNRSAATYVPNVVNTFTLLTLTGLNSITDWTLDAQSRIPTGTNVRYYLVDNVGTQYDIIDGKPLFTKAISGTVLLKADVSTTNPELSPVIFQGTQLIGGTAVSPGNYISRQFPIANGTIVAATINLIIDQYVPSTTTVTPQVQLADNSFANMTFSSSVDIGNGWTTATYTYANLSANASRLQIVEAITTDPSVRPQVQNIRLVVL